jgi:hypothetical protein
MNVPLDNFLELYSYRQEVIWVHIFVYQYTFENCMYKKNLIYAS